MGTSLLSEIPASPAELRAAITRGWVLDEKTGLLKMYYGAADSCIAMATASVSDLLEYIRKCPEPCDESLY